MSIEHKIRLLLDKKNMRITELAKKLDRSRQNIYDIFNNKQRVSMELLEQIAAVLDVSPSYFLEDTPTIVGESPVEYNPDQDDQMTERIIKVLINENKELNRRVWELEQLLEKYKGTKN
jgi:transcriptional regulator with XRE-family HTH domain